MANKALLVGINKYQTMSWLNGCHNDVRNVYDLLTRQYAFETGSVNRLMEQDVLKPRLLSRMESLLSDARPGDHLVFHFSGHGSYIRDESGDEHDGLDELICLWDYPSGYVTDDELRAWTRRCPAGARLTVILDACHSGTGTRVVPRLTEDPGDVIEPGDEPDAPSLPRDVFLRFADPIPADAGTLAGSRSGGLTEEEMNHLLLAAARDDQEAGDGFIAGAHHGVFTYYLCAVARHYQGRLSYRQLIDVVRRNLRAKGYAQIPQLEGPSADKDRPVLS